MLILKTQNELVVYLGSLNHLLLLLMELPSLLLQFLHSLADRLHLG